MGRLIPSLTRVNTNGTEAKQIYQIQCHVLAAGLHTPSREDTIEGFLKDISRINYLVFKVHGVLEERASSTPENASRNPNTAR